MSLKAFHVFFIAVSIVLSVGFGTWAVRGYMVEGGGLYLIWVTIAAAGAVGLGIYEANVVKKLKHL